MIKSFFLVLFLLSSCRSVVNLIDGDNEASIVLKEGQQKQVILAFSHNINGETHPCGCRKFPLGGIPQVAGILHHWQEKAPLLYLDTGDTFFPSPILPDSLRDSLLFTAKELASFMDSLGLKYFVPGDQDFAAGIDFLQEISKKHQFKFLLTNLKEKSKIKHIKHASLALPNQTKIHFFGLLHASHLQRQYKKFFSDPYSALKNEMEKIKIHELDRVVVLSHQGMDLDKELAKKIPRIDWIIGAHNQSFTQKAREQGKTQLVQVLSRNHHLGRINISMSNRKRDSFEIQEVREEWDQKLKPNPYNKKLLAFKENLREVQKKEQEKMTTSPQQQAQQEVSTAKHCMTCHEAQSEFWSGTAHASAFHTLVIEKADKNTNCIGCHSLYFQKEQGFKKSSHFVSFRQADKKREQYLKEFYQLSHGIKSIRKLSIDERQKLSNKQFELDQKFHIKQNFAHVQCLHCHQQSMEHPFEEDDSPKMAVEASSCLGCHTKDQSPSWYHKKSSGELGNLKQTVYQKKLETIACPRME